LRRDVDRDPAVLPVADGLVRLHRVVHHDLRPVLRLDDNVGLGDPTFEIAALVVCDVGDERLLPHRFVGIEQRLSTSHCTSICSRAAWACPKVSAATAATACPTYPGSSVSASTSGGPTTARTPGAFRAGSRSIDVTRARAYGLLSTAACSIPGSWM